MAKITRRSFVATSVAGAASVAAGSRLLSGPQPAQAGSANDRVVLALIGAGLPCT